MNVLKPKTGSFMKRDSDSVSILHNKTTIFNYRKIPKNSDTRKYTVKILKFDVWIFYREMRPNNADGMANSVDPDQTAPLGAVWFGSTQFAQTCLSENLGNITEKLTIKVLQFSSPKC